jgi:outer membrane protein assembly factor BamE (lipoprotein component of BamABCDE complex)
MRFALLISSALVLAGCAGNLFSFDNARKVQAGMTEQEVRGIMGKPTNMTASPGQVLWIYAYGTAWGKSASVSYVFTNGVVAKVPEIPTSFK